MARGYLQFISGDFGKTKYTYTGGNSLSKNNIFGPSLKISDIESCEEQTAGESVKKAAGTVGGAVIGGVLTGGIGAIVGGMAGGNHVETTVIIKTIKGKEGLARANGPMMDAIRGRLYDVARAQAEGRPIPKPKGSIWKKILIGLAILAILGAILGKEKEEQTQQVAPQEQTSSPRKNKQPAENPCEGMTPERWDNASKLWKAAHPECRPKGR